MQHLKLFLQALILVTALNSHAQKQFTHTATKANNWCNGTCTLVDIPELNNNPGAILRVTTNTTDKQSVMAYYVPTKKNTFQWSIMSLDNSVIVPGTQFSLQYYASADDNHFVHVVTRENNFVNEDKIKKKGSYIDHPTLNNHPGAAFTYFQNWAPTIRGGVYNKYEIQFQYDVVSGRWFMSNNNQKELGNSTAYNIFITNAGNTVADPGKKDPVISKKDPKIILNPEDSLPPITRPVGKTGPITKKTIAPSYDFSKTHICIDKQTNNSLPPRIPVTPQRVIPKINSTGGIEPVTTIIQPLSGETAKMWRAGDTITVGFFSDGDEFVTSKVKHFVKE
ncbi:MAG: hypothetical protein ABIT05_11725, partial [Chitinophagaceae bacterium]